MSARVSHHSIIPSPVLSCLSVDSPVVEPVNSFVNALHSIGTTRSTYQRLSHPPAHRLRRQHPSSNCRSACVRWLPTDLCLSRDASPLWKRRSSPTHHNPCTQLQHCHESEYEIDCECSLQNRTRVDQRRWRTSGYPEYSVRTHDPLFHATTHFRPQHTRTGSKETIAPLSHKRIRLQTGWVRWEYQNWHTRNIRSQTTVGLLNTEKWLSVIHKDWRYR